MSEKYSTKELINDIESWPVHDGIRDAIIARLRAADKLCVAAKGVFWMQSIYPHIDLSKIDKAIAEYEGEVNLD